MADLSYTGGIHQHGFLGQREMLTGGWVLEVSRKKKFKAGKTLKCDNFLQSQAIFEAESIGF